MYSRLISIISMVKFDTINSQLVFFIISGTFTNTSVSFQPKMWMNTSVYLCRNHEMISLLGRCDGRFDCFDASDEEGCPDTTGSTRVILFIRVENQ